MGAKSDGCSCSPDGGSIPLLPRQRRGGRRSKSLGWCLARASARGCLAVNRGCFFQGRLISPLRNTSGKLWWSKTLLGADEKQDTLGEILDACFQHRAFSLRRFPKCAPPEAWARRGEHIPTLHTSPMPFFLKVFLELWSCA